MCYHSLFGFPFSCTVPTVTKTQYITPNTINREIQINLRNIKRGKHSKHFKPLCLEHTVKLYSSLLPSRPQTTGSHVTVLGTPGTFYTFISSQSPASFIGRKKRSVVESFHPQRTLAIELSCKERVKYKRSFGKGLKKIVQKCAILAKRCERLARQLSCASS